MTAPLTLVDSSQSTSRRDLAPTPGFTLGSSPRSSRPAPVQVAQATTPAAAAATHRRLLADLEREAEGLGFSLGDALHSAANRLSQATGLLDVPLSPQQRVGALTQVYREAIARHAAGDPAVPLSVLTDLHGALNNQITAIQLGEARAAQLGWGLASGTMEFVRGTSVALAAGIGTIVGGGPQGGIVAGGLQSLGTLTAMIGSAGLQGIPLETLDLPRRLLSDAGNVFTVLAGPKLLAMMGLPGAPTANTMRAIAMHMGRQGMIDGGLDGLVTTAVEATAGGQPLPEALRAGAVQFVTSFLLSGAFNGPLGALDARRQVDIAQTIGMMTDAEASGVARSVDGDFARRLRSESPIVYDALNIRLGGRLDDLAGTPAPAARPSSPAPAAGRLPDETARAYAAEVRAFMEDLSQSQGASATRYGPETLDRIDAQAQALYGDGRIGADDLANVRAYTDHARRARQAAQPAAAPARPPSDDEMIGRLVRDGLAGADETAMGYVARQIDETRGGRTGGALERWLRDLSGSPDTVGRIVDAAHATFVSDLFDGVFEGGVDAASLDRLAGAIAERWRADVAAGRRTVGAQAPAGALVDDLFAFTRALGGSIRPDGSGVPRPTGVLADVMRNAGGPFDAYLPATPRPAEPAPDVDPTPQPEPAVPEPQLPPTPEIIAQRMVAARAVARDAAAELIGPAARTLDDAALDRFADVLGRRLAVETDGTRPAMRARIAEIGRDPAAVDTLLREAGIDLPATATGRPSAGGAPLEPEAPVVVALDPVPPRAEAPSASDAPRPAGDGYETIVPGVLDTGTMGPLLDVGALLPAARQVATESLPAIIGADAVARLTPLERTAYADALAHALAAQPVRAVDGMREHARALAGNPAAVAELADVARGMVARDLVDEVMLDPAMIDPAIRDALSPTELGQARAALAERLLGETDGSEAGMRAAIGGLEPNAFLRDLLPEESLPISLAQSLRVDRQTFVDALGYARNRIEATPDPADYPVYTPGLEDTVPQRTIRLREIRPRENDPSQPMLNFINDRVLGNPLVRAALKRNGIDEVYLSETGIRTGISGLGSQTRQFTEIDQALQTLRHGLGDIGGAAARGDWNGVQAATADLLRDLDRNSDQAFRPNRGTISEVVQAPGVTQMLQLGATMGPGLVNDQLPALPGEMARSLFVEMSAKNNLYDLGGTGALVLRDPTDPSAGYRLNVAWDEEAGDYVLLAPLRVKSIAQAEVLLQLPEALNPAQIPFVGGLYPSLEIRTMDYVGSNAGYFDLPPGTRFTPRQVALLNEGILDPALFSEAGQDPDVHRELMRTFEALSLPFLPNTNIRNRDDPFSLHTPDREPGAPYRLRTDFELGLGLTVTPAAGTPLAPLSKFFPIGVTPFRGGIGGVFKFDVFPTPPGTARLIDVDPQANVRSQSALPGANEALPQSVTTFRLPPELQTGSAADRQTTVFVSIPSAAALPFAEGTQRWTRHSQEAVMATLNQLDAANRGPEGGPVDAALERALNAAYLVFGRDPAEPRSGVSGEQREALRDVIEAELARAQRLVLADEDGAFEATLGGTPQDGGGPTATPQRDLDTDI